MKARSIDCCHTRARNSRTGWSRGAVGGVLFAVSAALMPKCPMCIAAWLGVLGLSGLAARVDPRALWLAAALSGAALGAAIAHRLLGRGDSRAACPQGSGANKNRAACPQGSGANKKGDET
jgi:hypothetical protein